MQRIAIIGDSNVYRNTTSERLSNSLKFPVTLIKSTQMMTLEIGVREAATHDLVLVSALGNIISDAGRGVEVDKIPDCITATVKSYVKALVGPLSKTKILLLQPTFRADPHWFGTHLPLLKSTLCIETSQYSNITMLPDFSITGVDLLSDGVHYLPEKGVCFVMHLISCLQDVVNMSVPSSLQPSTSSMIFAPSKSSTIEDVMILLHTSVLPRLDDLSGLKNQVMNLEQKIFTRLDHNDTVSARLAEEQDLARNKETSDRVVVVGYKADDYPDTERKKFLVNKFRRLIEHIVGEVVYDIYPKAESLPPTGIVPTFELKFNQSKLCTNFKQAAFKKIRESEFSEEFEGVSFYPRVTIGTRVRMEILRAIARKVQSDEEVAYCPIFGIRPVLHVGPVSNGKVTRTKTFTL